MKTRSGAIVALLLAAVVTVAASAGVAAMSLDQPSPKPAAGPRVADDVRAVPHRALAAPSNPTNPVISGIASNYAGTAGWIGEPTVALPGALGGAYTGQVGGYVMVCADRCARLPVVDWCGCYWGSADERVVDLSHAAWALVSDAPLSTGLIEVRIVRDG